MLDQELINSLNTLLQKLNTAQPENAVDALNLERLKTDIQKMIIGTDGPTEVEKDSLLDTLKIPIETFEIRYPEVTAALDQVMAVLSGMGI